MQLILLTLTCPGVGLGDTSEPNGDSVDLKFSTALSEKASTADEAPLSNRNNNNYSLFYDTCHDIIQITTCEYSTEVPYPYTCSKYNRLIHVYIQ